MKKKILFLCTGNSCRSQMAEGWARHLHGDWLEPYSAGIEVHGLNPYAIAVMAETGVNISRHQSQLVGDLKQDYFDLVVTVCNHADTNCPYLPDSTKKVHHGFDDPPRCAEGVSSDEDILDCYRRVRDEIKGFVESFNVNAKLFFEGE